MFRVPSKPPPLRQLICRQFSQKATIQEGDVVLLRKKRPPIFRPILTSPLRKDKIIRGTSKIDLKGTIKEESIIGKGIRDIITSTKGDEYRIHDPSLGEYIKLSPRLVTPIYPASASLMVDLLDLHPTTYIEGDDPPPLEIFEAGTGHGSLTLHLSRAIHGANSRPPALPPLSVLKKLRPYHKEKPVSPLDDNQAPQIDLLATAQKPATLQNKHSSGTSLDSQSAEILTSGFEDHIELVQDVKAESVKWLQFSHDLIAEYEKDLLYTHEMKAEYEQWLKTRRAIVRTLDISSHHSEHAEQIIRSYRQGIYYPNISFHVGTITEYLSERLKNDPEPFLQHVILDLPETHKYLDLIAKALKPNGILLLFCPSVTQIIPGIQRVKNERLPFHLEKVLEIGGSGIGGRNWDLKLVKTRKQLKEEARTKGAEKQYISNGESGAVEVDQGVAGEVPVEESDDWNIICHPEPGGRVDAGAFIAVWRRMEQH